MNRLLQDTLLSTYRLVFVRGLFRLGIGRRLFFALYDHYKLRFEAGPIERLRRYAPEGALVIDVGANVGFFTLRFARWVGAEGRIIAIEPEQQNFAELTRRLKAGKLAERVEVHRAVADAKPGEACLVVNPDHPGDHRLGERGLPVPAVTIDALTEHLSRMPSLIKIDVQGAEMRVLAGAERTLQRAKPALFIEVDPANLASFGCNAPQLFGYLYELGYRPFRLQHDGPPCPLSQPEQDALFGRRGYADILFTTVDVQARS